MKSMKKWRNALMVHFHHNCNITLLPIFYKRNVIFLAVIFQHCNKKNVIAAVEQCTSCKKKSTVALIFSRNVFRMYLFVSWTILRIELQASSIFPTWLRPARERYIPQREGPILQEFLVEKKKRTYFSHELVQKY